MSGRQDLAGPPHIDASLADYGIGTAAWPTTLDAARPVFDALPDTAAGKPKDAGPWGHNLQAMYGSERAIFSVISVPAGASAAVSLAEEAAYMPCEKESRVGTAPLPGLPSASDDPEVWFACHLTGYSDQRAGAMDAQFLAWTSGGLVWWVEAPDRATIAELLTPLAETAGPAVASPDGTGDPSTSSTSTSPAAAEVPYGIADAKWPTTLEDVAQMDLPAVGGSPARVSQVGRKFLFVRYPGGGQVLIAGPDQQGGPSAMLSFLFGLTYSCAPGTFEGTALGIGGHPERAAASAPVTWFRCDVHGAEGNPRYRGYATGWTSGDLAWLVLAPDASTTEDLVNGLADAAGS